MRSRGPPSASSTVSRDAPKPTCVSSCAKAAGPSAVGGQRQNARARLQMRAEQIERAAVQREQHRLRQRPAEPRRREAEGRRRRHHDHLARHRCGAPAPRRRRNGTDRRRRARRPAGRDGAALRRRRRRTGSATAAPRRGSAAPRGQDGAGRRTRSRRAPISPRATGAQTLDAVLADADDGQPARRCGSVGLRSRQEAACHASSSSAARRKRGCWPADWRRRGRSRRHAVARRPHRRAGGAAGAGAQSAASAAPTGLRIIWSRERIDVLIDATHPYADHHVGQCRRGGAPDRSAVGGDCAGRPGSRRSPATAGPRWAMCAAAVRALGPDAAACFRRARPQRARAVLQARRSIII